MTNEEVKRRALFFIGGYDPVSPSEFFGRFERHLGQSGAVYGLTPRLDVQESTEADIGLAALTTSGEDWATRAQFHFLALDGLVETDFAKPLPVRTLKYIGAFADFVFTGTAFRMFRHAWRFGLYFLYPALVVALFLLAGLAAGWLASRWISWGGVILGAAVWYGLQATLGKRWSINHLMDLWSFSAHFIRGKRRDAEDLLQRFAAHIAARAREGELDELILIGHSTGGVLILDVLRRLQKIDPDFASRTGRVSILTLGSTALKAGLHPAAGDLREAVQKAARDPGLSWVEVQCLTDPINFYHTEPAALMGAVSREDFALVRHVKVKHMLDRPRYDRAKRSMFRIHYQYVFGNTVRYWYDFMLICCGPTDLVTRCRDYVVGPRAFDESSSK